MLGMRERALNSAFEAMKNMLACVREEEFKEVQLDCSRAANALIRVVMGMATLEKDAGGGAGKRKRGEVEMRDVYCEAALHSYLCAVTALHKTFLLFRGDNGAGMFATEMDFSKRIDTVDAALAVLFEQERATAGTIFPLWLGARGLCMACFLADYPRASALSSGASKEYASALEHLFPEEADHSLPFPVTLELRQRYDITRNMFRAMDNPADILLAYDGWLEKCHRMLAQNVALEDAQHVEDSVEQQQQEQHDDDDDDDDDDDEQQQEQQQPPQPQAQQQEKEKEEEESALESARKRARTEEEPRFEETQQLHIPARLPRSDDRFDLLFPAETRFTVIMPSGSKKWGIYFAVTNDCLRITRVMPKSIAESFGIRKGDGVVQISGEKVCDFRAFPGRSKDDFVDILGNLKSRGCRLEMYRPPWLSFTVELPTKGKWGLTFTRGADDPGIVVDGAEEHSVAAQSGLVAGHVITGINCGGEQYDLTSSTPQEAKRIIVQAKQASFETLRLEMLMKSEPLANYQRGRHQQQQQQQQQQHRAGNDGDGEEEEEEQELDDGSSDEGGGETQVR
eukprot:g1621.t1